MNLVDQSRLDIQQITGETGDFSVAIAVTNPTGPVTANVFGFHTKHWMQFDPMDGVMVNAKMASVAIAEQQFVDAAFPVRTDDEVKMNEFLNLFKEVV